MDRDGTEPNKSKLILMCGMRRDEKKKKKENEMKRNRIEKL